MYLWVRTLFILPVEFHVSFLGEYPLQALLSYISFLVLPSKVSNASLFSSTFLILRLQGKLSSPKNVMSFTFLLRFNTWPMKPIEKPIYPPITFTILNHSSSRRKCSFKVLLRSSYDMPKKYATMLWAWWDNSCMPPSSYFLVFVGFLYWI